MKSSLKKVKDCKVKLFVEVDPERVEERFGHVLREFQKAAKLPGFREGKAPMEMVEKRYAKEAEEEVLKDLIPEAYHQSIVEQKVSPVTLPSISDIQWERGKKLSFCAEFEKSPEFSLKNYKGLKIIKLGMEVGQDDIDKGLNALLESKAELVPIVETRAVEKGDFIISDIEIWQDGNYKPGRKGVLLVAEPSEHDDFFSKVVGANIDEVREVSVAPTEEEKKQGVVGMKPLYKVWVRSINQKKTPPLDDTFAKSFGKDTIDDLKEAIRKDIASHKQADSYQKMKDELFDKLLGLVSFTLPEGVVQRQKERLLEQAKRQHESMGHAPHAFDDHKDEIEKDADEKAKNQVKLYFILQRIAEEEGLEISEEELEQRLLALSEKSKRPLDEVRQVFEEDLRESMKESKTVEFLLANAKLEETSTTN